MMKNENSGVGNRMISVNLEVLNQGLMTAFQGVAMIFSSLGAIDAAEEITAAAKDKSVMGQAPEGGYHLPPEEELPFDAQGYGEDMVGKAADAADTGAADTVDTAEPEKPTEDKPTESATAPIPSITIDDITKVIVAKIKKKRDNNAKIGSLLKTYGVDKVSSLPPEKYEAFLTDISQL